MRDQTQDHNGMNVCRICDQEFESERELNEHQRDSHQREGSSENSGYRESDGA